MGNAFREARTLTLVERRRIQALRAKYARRLLWARAGFYGDLSALLTSLLMIQLGHHTWLTVFALATMPGVLGLVFGGAAIRPLGHLVASLKKDLQDGTIEIYGDEDVVRLPNSGLALIVHGNQVEPGSAFPVAVGAPRTQNVTYPARLEWSHERRMFTMCRRLSPAELEELQQLRRRIATRYLCPAFGFMAFSFLALWVLNQSGENSDRLVPVAVVLACVWFAWRLVHDLAVAARLGREHAVVTDSVHDGRREHAVEVLPYASLVWTVDRTPANWRF